MKIFDEQSVWRSKVNFVDENNVFLGYDMSQNCCEHADWFISDELVLEYPNQGILENKKVKDGLEKYRFDTEYFKDYDDGELHMAIFKIINGENEKYIHIFNSHNGFYSHGFVFSIDGEKEKKGHL